MGREIIRLLGGTKLALMGVWCDCCMNLRLEYFKAHSKTSFEYWVIIILNNHHLDL